MLEKVDFVESSDNHNSTEEGDDGPSHSEISESEDDDGRICPEGGLTAE